MWQDTGSKNIHKRMSVWLKTATSIKEMSPLLITTPHPSVLSLLCFSSSISYRNTTGKSLHGSDTQHTVCALARSIQPSEHFVEECWAVFLLLPAMIGGGGEAVTETKHSDNTVIPFSVTTKNSATFSRFRRRRLWQSRKQADKNKPLPGISWLTAFKANKYLK